MVTLSERRWPAGYVLVVPPQERDRALEGALGAMLTSAVSLLVVTSAGWK